MYSFGIVNDVASQIEIASISADIVYIAHFASGNAALVNSQTNKTLYLLAVNSQGGLYLYTTYSYVANVTTPQCLGMTIVNDQQVLLACSDGVRLFTVTTYSIVYVGMAWTSGGSYATNLNDVQFYAGQH